MHIRGTRGRWVDSKQVSASQIYTNTSNEHTFSFVMHSIPICCRNNCQLSYLPDNKLTDCMKPTIENILTDWAMDWLMDWLINCLINWLTDWKSCLTQKGHTTAFFFRINWLSSGPAYHWPLSPPLRWTLMLTRVFHNLLIHITKSPISLGSYSWK